MKAKQTDTEAAVEQAQQWADELGEIAELISDRFSRTEARERAVNYLRGLLSPVERKNSWQLAEEIGDETPYATQHLVLRQNSIHLRFQQLRLTFSQPKYSRSRFALSVEGSLITPS